LGKRDCVILRRFHGKLTQLSPVLQATSGHGKSTYPISGSERACLVRVSLPSLLAFWRCARLAANKPDN